MLQRKIVLGVRIIGFEPEGFLELGGGVVGLALGGKEVAEVITGFGVSRLEPDGFLELHDGVVGFAGGGEIAKVVMGLGKIRF